MMQWTRTDVGVFFRLCALILVLAGCAGERRARGPSIGPAQARATIERSLPRGLSDRTGWTADMLAAFTVLELEPSHENICAVVAVIAQESGFRVDPVVPGLPAIAWKEIDERAAHVGVPRVVVHGVLQLPSASGRTFSERIDHATTEKELSDIFEDFIGAVPMGRTLFADHNPIRTRGPMQVHIVFAEKFAKVRPYPYPIKMSIADEVFTRRGGLYFGMAHLLDYPADYDRYLYRFADFNAGQYASRNAAFQAAVTAASGIPLIPDGALLPREEDTGAPGATELALRAMASRLEIGESGIHAALELMKTKEFEKTTLYQRVYRLAEQSADPAPPRAMVPRIDLHGPKITRKLTTEWYANRVEGRYEDCLSK